MYGKELKCCLCTGPYGINHGVEQHTDVVEYARERLDEFKKNSPAFDEFDFCEPTFVVGNCLCLNSGCQLYDRVYVGAACPPEHENYMKNLIKIGGVLVMPLNDKVSCSADLAFQIQFLANLSCHFWNLGFGLWSVTTHWFGD